jgi:hypothetical protein
MSYKGIKEFISEFKEPFDYKKKAKDRLRDNGERATKQAIEEEIVILKKEYDDAAKRGTALHKKIQDKKTKTKECVVEGWEDSSKVSLDPDLSTNILKNNTTYIEKKIISDKYKLVGYADEVNVVKNFINIEDTKTQKRIYRSSAIRLKNGFLLPPTYFYPPIDKLQACNYNDAALQMSLYLYLLWVHNKKLKPGKLHIRHIITNDKDDILSEELVEVPYLIDEVKKILKHRLKNGIS